MNNTVAKRFSSDGKVQEHTGTEDIKRDVTVLYKTITLTLMATTHTVICASEFQFKPQNLMSCQVRSGWKTYSHIESGK